MPLESKRLALTKKIWRFDTIPYFSPECIQNVSKIATTHHEVDASRRVRRCDVKAAPIIPPLTPSTTHRLLHNARTLTRVYRVTTTRTSRCARASSESPVWHGSIVVVSISTPPTPSNSWHRLQCAHVSMRRRRYRSCARVSTGTVRCHRLILFAPLTPPPKSTAQLFDPRAKPRLRDKQSPHQSKFAPRRRARHGERSYLCLPTYWVEPTPLL